MGVVVVWAAELRSQPCWLGIGHWAEVAGQHFEDFRLLALDDTDAEVAVFLEDFLTVEVVEDFGGVLTGDFLQHVLSTWMGIEEIGNIVDFVINDEPRRVLRVMLGDLRTSERWLRHDDGDGKAMRGLEMGGWESELEENGMRRTG